MNTEPENNGRSQTEEDVDLRLAFQRSAPSFADVDVDAVWRDANGDARKAAMEVGQLEIHSDRGADISSSKFLSQRRFTMLKRMGLVGVCAASLCLAIVFGLWGSNTVLAQVQNAIKKAKSASYTVTQSVGDNPAMSWKVKLLGENLCRCEQDNGTYFVFDIQAKKMMEVNPAESKVRITENLPVPDGFNILSKLANPNSIAVTEQPPVPAREFGGKKATGFVIEENGIRYNMWIDPATNLPLEMELVRTEPKGNMRDLKEKWTELRFDEQLDPSLFKFQPPKGFRVEIRKAPASDPRKAVEEERSRAEKAYEEAKKAKLKPE